MPDQVQTILAYCAKTPAPFHGYIPLGPQDCTLIGAALATCGWVYTARRGRVSAKKQHTINVLMQGEFNEQFKKAEKLISPHKNCGALLEISTLSQPEKDAFQFVLNHYEFLAAGIRNGDFDERLVLDTLRSTIINLFETCENSIYTMRNSRKRQSFYEHLEWLHARWRRKKQKFWTRAIEWIIGRPLRNCAPESE